MLERIIVIALMTFGYCATFWPGMIFEKLGNKLEQHLPERVTKPLFGCYICATMWFGSLAYWVGYHHDVVNWLGTCIGAMGFNALLSKILGWFEDDIELKEVNTELSVKDNENVNNTSSNY